jgi:hypothetical protein
VFNRISVAHDTNKMLNSFFWIKHNNDPSTKLT